MEEFDMFNDDTYKENTNDTSKVEEDKADSFKEEEIESILYIGREVSVYKIPPRRMNEGYRAQEWGDLAAPLWKGRIRIIERSAGVALQFEDATTGDLFAKADYDPAKPCVENVLDSSRYFVIQVSDQSRKAYIGMGFAERPDSFDFNVALQDYTKRWKARSNPTAGADEPSPHIPQGPKKDYTLKDGQTFTISIPGKNKASQNNKVVDLFGSGTPSSSKTSGSGFPGLLPPPPSAPRN